jgi:peptide/nickel transport system permease protein
VRLAKAIFFRLLYGLLSLLFITFVTFIAGELAPGDAARQLAGEKATEAQYQRMRENLGLNRPWPERYAMSLVNAARVDFGRSFHGTNEPVTDIIARKLPITARVATMAILLAAVVGIFLGLIGAIHKNKFGDRAVLVISTLGVTVPNFVLAPLLVYIFAVQLDMLPQTWAVERPMGDFYYLVLPVALLAARPMAMLTRLTRASMVDTLQHEFIRLAIAKGVPFWRLIFRHALRNAILPIVTAIGTSFGFLLTGSFVIERIFAIPGLGSETIEAIRRQDTPVVQACVLVTGMMFVLINMLVDLILPILDPRIREAQV